MASLSSIVDMNTTAVALMQQNNQAGAIASFQQALTCLRQLVQTADDSNFHHPPCTAKNHGSRAPSMDTTNAMQSDPSDNKVVCSVSIDHVLHSTNTNLLSISPANLFEFYNQAFVFSCNETGELPVVSKSIVTAVLLFNMAVTLHGKAVRSGASGVLRRSLKLYKMSLAVLQQDPALHVLHLALLNNMGYIYSHFYEWEEMKQCRETFTSTCKMLKDLTAKDSVFFSFVLLTNYCKSPVSPAA